MGLDESILDDVERVVLVAEHAEREGVRAAMVAIEQRPERIPIAAPGGLDQLAVIDGFTSGGRSLALLIHAGPVISPEPRNVR